MKQVEKVRYSWHLHDIYIKGCIKNRLRPPEHCSLLLGFLPVKQNFSHLLCAVVLLNQFYILKHQTLQFLMYYLLLPLQQFCLGLPSPLKGKAILITADTISHLRYVLLCVVNKCFFFFFWLKSRCNLSPTGNLKMCRSKPSNATRL